MLNNSLIKYFLPAIRTTIVLALITGILFPFFIYFLCHLLFPYQAEGSLLHNSKGTIIGSKLIGQTFVSPKYFHPRPSAAGTGYDASASGGTNLAATSDKLINGTPLFQGIQQLASFYRCENYISELSIIPVDAVTRSASGLDPHISVQNANIQATRVAQARHMPIQIVLSKIKAHTLDRQFSLFGEPRVHVLELNLDLDKSLLSKYSSQKKGSQWQIPIKI